MVQVMTKNHFGANQAEPSLDLETSWALNHRPCAPNEAKVRTNVVLVTIPRKWDTAAKFSPEAFAPGARMTAVNQFPQKTNVAKETHWAVSLMRI